MKKGVLRKFRKVHRKTPALDSLLLKRLQHSCFPLKFAKFLTPNFKGICERLLLVFVQLENYGRKRTSEEGRKTSYQSS